MTMPKLLPCPFCGGAPEKRYRISSRHKESQIVQCERCMCNALTPELWNQRSDLAETAWQPIEHCPYTPGKRYDIFTNDGDLLMGWLPHSNGAGFMEWDGFTSVTNKELTHYRESDVREPPVANNKTETDK